MTALAQLCWTTDGANDFCSFHPLRLRFECSFLLLNGCVFILRGGCVSPHASRFCGFYRPRAISPPLLRRPICKHDLWSPG